MIDNYDVPEWIYTQLVGLHRPALFKQEDMCAKKVEFLFIHQDQFQNHG